MSDEHGDLPYGTEYAKSGRSMCKRCKKPVDKGALRMSRRTKSQHFDGLQDNWFHFDCFWTSVKTPMKEGDVRGMDWLQWDDQQKIKAKIDALAQGNPSGADDAADAAPLEWAASKSANARAKCKACANTIAKDASRLTSSVGSKRTNYHMQCVLGDTKAHKFLVDDISKVSGADALDEADAKALADAVKEVHKSLHPDKPAKRPAASDSDIGPAAKKSKSELKQEKKLKEQAETQWQLRVDLRENVHKDDMTALLVENKQLVPSGVDKILDRLIDCMMFGVPDKCSMCHKGQIVYSTTHQTYACTGNVNEWTKCDYRSDEPARSPLRIPAYMRKENEWLKKFKFEPDRKRIYDTSRTQRTDTVPSESLYSSSSSKAGAKSRGAKSSSAKSKSVKCTMKNGSVVDPECDVAHETHVYRDKGGVLWTAILNKFQIETDQNTFYKLQLLQHDNDDSYYVFRAWGRIGTGRGGTKLDEFDSDLDGAQALFESLYADKSGNAWSDKDNFQKKPGKMYPVEVDHGGDDAVQADWDSGGVESKLAPEVQTLIRCIFDTDSMKRAMKEFEIDLEKMPLGKLSKAQIQRAYKVLTEADNALAADPQRKGALKFRDITNRFYTLIPHDFGDQRPPLIDNKQLIEEKCSMLESLLEMEVAYSILQEGQAAGAQAQNPIDAHYDKLSAHIEVLDKKSDEFKVIKKAVKNTHGSTHTTYGLDIDYVLRVSRSGERDKYECKSTSIEDKRLLWHGSRTTNYAGIIKQGLRIAPPEAPVTGYMFGKGIYFADMVSKSANYCHASTTNPYGLLLLCEVALGQLDTRQQADSNLPKTLKKGKTSVLGEGQNVPSELTTLQDGTKVATGKVGGGPSTSLLYNEFIVYDEAQVNIRYLIRAKFNYKL